MARADNSNSASAINDRFNRMNQVKKFLRTALAFAIVISALPVSAATGALDKLPLFFEANGSAQFLARGSDFQFSISAAGGQFTLRKSGGESAEAQMQFIGANPAARIGGENELPGKINYLLGDRPAQWRAGVPIFAKVRVQEIYPGIGLVYYGNSRRLEYDFTVAPKADPNLIAMRFNGVKSISINARGELILNLGNGEICHRPPVIYQIRAGGRKEISRA